MKLVRTAVRLAVALPGVGRVLARSFSKANAYFHSVSNERLLEIYQRHKEYTRLPAEIYVANLEVLERFADVEGCVVECGVWRGGMSAGMADLLGDGRTYYLFDSFEGLPEAKPIDGPKALDWQARGEIDNCRTEEQFAREAMSRSKSGKYELHKGWFENTLKDFRPAEPIAVLRLDADWYSSTAECLNHLYPLVREGGLVLIDDYYAWTGCSRAVHDYLAANALADRIRGEDGRPAYFAKVEITDCVAINPHRQL
jgi:O-methyltransferase